MILVTVLNLTFNEISQSSSNSTTAKDMTLTAGYHTL